MDNKLTIENIKHYHSIVEQIRVLEDILKYEHSFCIAYIDPWRPTNLLAIPGEFTKELKVLVNNAISQKKNDLRMLGVEI